MAKNPKSPDRPPLTILGKPEPFDSRPAACSTSSPSALIKIEKTVPLEVSSASLGDESVIAYQGKSLLCHESRAGVTVEIRKRDSNGIYPVMASSAFLPGVMQRGTFTIPFSAQYVDHVLADMRMRVQQSGARAIAATAAEERESLPTAPEDFGGGLFDALFKNGLRELLAKSVERAGTLFPISIATSAPEVQRLPWEFLYDGNRYLCTFVGPIFRVVPDSHPNAPEMQIVGPLRVLVFPSVVPGQVSIDYLGEISDITASLRIASIENEVKVVESQEVNDFQRLLLMWKPHVIHFIAHGEENSLLFRKADGAEMRVGNVLGALMLNAPVPPRIVILNACDSSGLAAGLVKARVPMAVGMQFAISDSAGTKFSKGFYQYVSAGLPIHRAAAWGRLMIQAELGEQTREWATPVVYVNPRKVDLS